MRKNQAGRWIQCEGSCRDKLEHLESTASLRDADSGFTTQILTKIFRRYIQSKISHNVSITPNPYAMG